MLEKLLNEQAQIKKSLEGFTLEHLYEEKEPELQRLYEITDEIRRLKGETHSS